MQPKIKKVKGIHIKEEILFGNEILKTIKDYFKGICYEELKQIYIQPN